ncbi:MAG: hypothetical protein R6V73_06095 [Anaerolineales bacterium]
MSTKTRKNKRKSTGENNQPAESFDINSLKRSWISMRTGIRLITVISVGLGLFTSFNLRAMGWGESLLWGLVFGGSIWLVFFLILWVNRLLKQRSQK